MSIDFDIFLNFFGKSIYVDNNPAFGRIPQIVVVGVIEDVLSGKALVGIIIKGAVGIYGNRPVFGGYSYVVPGILTEFRKRAFQYGIL